MMNCAVFSHGAIDLAFYSTILSAVLLEPRSLENGPELRVALIFRDTLGFFNEEHCRLSCACVVLTGLGHPEREYWSNVLLRGKSAA